MYNYRWVKRLSPHVALGLKIKEVRALRGITQEDLAETVGVFRTYMSRIETGVANPTFSMMLALADALAVTVCDLLQPPASRTPPRVRSVARSSRGRVIR